MYLTFYLVELLLFICASSQETGADDPDPNLAVATEDENTEITTTEKNKLNLVTTEIPEGRADVSEDLEVKTSSPEESTQAVEKRSDRNETATEDQLRSAPDEKVVTVPTSVSDTSEDSSDIKERTALDQDEKLTGPNESQNNGVENPPQASHVNPNNIIDVKSRSGRVEGLKEHGNNFRRFDLGSEVVSNIRSQTVPPMRPNIPIMMNNNGYSTSHNPRHIKGYNYGIINEMLPYYTGKPIEQYSNEQTNTYTYNPRPVQNKRVPLPSNLGDRNVATNYDTRPVYKNNLAFQYPYYGNDHAGYFKSVKPEMPYNYNRPQKRLPVQTSVEKINIYVNERPNTPKNIGFNGFNVNHENMQKKPLEDLYRKLIVEKYAQTYTPLNYQNPDLMNSGQKLNGNENKIPTYYPKTNNFHENYGNTPSYYQNPVYNYGDVHRQL